MKSVFQTFSQFERNLIAERTRKGLESARARDRKGKTTSQSFKNLENFKIIVKSGVEYK